MDHLGIPPTRRRWELLAYGLVLAAALSVVGVLYLAITYSLAIAR